MKEKLFQSQDVMVNIIIWWLDVGSGPSQLDSQNFSKYFLKWGRPKNRGQVVTTQPS